MTRTDEVELAPLVPIDLRHFHALTDDTGILQHARYGVADRNHGYCTDDNARALIVACRCAGLDVEPGLERLVSRYLAFLHYAFDKQSGRFRNFMSYERRWLESIGSDDSHGRALQALGVAAASAPLQSQRDLAAGLFAEAVECVADFTYLRSCAFAAVGISEYLRAVGTDTVAHDLLSIACHRLLAAIEHTSTDDWCWFEPALTYANARLAHGLVSGGVLLDDPRMRDAGRRALRWLDQVQTAPEGHLSLIGCKGWYSRGGERARYDQQAVDAMSTLEAAADVYDLTGDEYWRIVAERCYQWYLGANDGGVALIDPDTGGCYDGLCETGVNLNMGAESTLAWLMSLTRMHQMRREPLSEAESAEGEVSSADVV